MTIVHSDHRISPDAQAKMADLTLQLARARLHIAIMIESPDPSTSEEHLTFRRSLLASIDKALEGTIHSLRHTEHADEH